MTAEEVEARRQQLIAERDEVTTKALVEKTPELLAKAASMYSLSERLKRRAPAQTRTVLFKDDLGEFRVPVISTPSKTLLFEIMDVMSRLQNLRGASAAEREELDEKLSRLMASICKDSSLDYEFWKNEDYPLELVMELLSGVMKGADQDSVDAKN